MRFSVSKKRGRDQSLQYGKKIAVFRILQFFFCTKDTSVWKTTKSIGPKRLEVFDTSFFLDTEVLPEYFKKTLLPNGA